MRYRLYIDEYGNSSLKTSSNDEGRYLSLTGVAIERDYVRTTAHPQFEALKHKYFPSHPDEPIILHRKELMQRNFPFAILRNPEKRTTFDNELFAYLEAWEYTVFTAVIDKSEHLQRYGAWSRNPYHYCLEVILERYVHWLEMRNSVGDVMAESRGTREDRSLASAFSGIYERGTDFIKSERFQSCLTSKQLKTPDKLRNIAGLQLADLMAFPGFLSCLTVHGETRTIAPFNARMITIMDHLRFYRSPGGRIDGYGRKWLP